MRHILNVSLPAPTINLLKTRVKRGGFDNVSEYIRALLELDSDLISKRELLEISRRADREYVHGKTKKLRSLADLI